MLIGQFQGNWKVKVSAL